MASKEIPSADRLGQVRLQPAARPTDQFYQPEVRYGSADPRQLLQLANSLQQLSGKTMDLSGTIAGTQVIEMREQALADIAKHRLDNKAKFKEAADNGLLPHADNPYYRETITEEVAKAEAVKIGNAAWTEFTQSPVQHSDNPEDYDRFFNERLAPALEGREQGEIAIMSSVFERSKRAFIGQAIQSRAAKRPEEMAVAVSTNLQTTLGHLSDDVLEAAKHGDPAAVAQVQSAQAEIQAHASQLGTVMPWTDVNRTIINAAHDTALLRRNSDLFETAVGAVKTAGGNLRDTGQARTSADELRQKIVRATNADLRTEAENRTLKAENAVREIIPALQAKLGEARKTNPGATLWDVRLSRAELDRLAPETQELLAERVQRLMALEKTSSDLAVKSKVDTLKSEFLPKFQSGTATKEEVLSYRQALALLHDDDDLQALDRMISDQQRQSDGFTTPSMRVELWRRQSLGTLDAGFILSGIESGTIAKSDGERHLGILLSSPTSPGSPESTALMERSVVSLVRAGFLDRNGAIRPDEVDLRADYQNLRDAALSKLHDDLYDLRQKGLPKAEYEAEAKKILDNVSQSFGGPTYAQWQQSSQQRTKPVPPPLKPSLQPGQKPADPVMEQVRKVDPVLRDFDNELVEDLKAMGNAPVVSRLKDLPYLSVDPRSKEGVEHSFGVDYIAAIRAFDTGGVGLAPGSGQADVAARDSVPKGELEQRQAEAYVGWVGKAQRQKAAIRENLIANGTREKLRTLAETYKARGQGETGAFLTDDEKAFRNRALLQVWEYAYLSRHLPLSDDELWQKDDTTGEFRRTEGGRLIPNDPNVWKTRRLFANDLDLDRRGRALFENLGIPAEKHIEAAAIQRLLNLKEKSRDANE